MGCRHAVLVLVGSLYALGCTKEPRDASREAPPITAAPSSQPAVAPAVDAAATVDAMTAPTLAVELTAEPKKLTRATRGKLMLTVTVKNLGTQTIDPEINLSELAVGGTPSKDWNMSLANSGRPKKWKALPAGESVSGSVAGLGEVLFPDAGDYTLVLTVSGVASAPVTIQVAR